MCHSPLTGIFLIRSFITGKFLELAIESQSPDGDFFDPERVEAELAAMRAAKSQSPDGDFFDPEPPFGDPESRALSGHSPLTGIFLIRRFV